MSVIRRFTNEELLAMARDGTITGQELAKLWNDERRNFPLVSPTPEVSGEAEPPDDFFERTGSRV